MSLSATAVDPRPASDLDAQESPGRPVVRPPADVSRRRFTIAVVVGIAVATLPMLWVMWDLWSGTVDPLRAVPYSNFYDLQARAIFHGHLYLPNGHMGIEAFVHDGRQFTYFGIFPSLIRMPILLVTSRLDGKMTAPSILTAWLLTGLLTSLLIWRLRLLIRGSRALLGRMEAVSFGILMAVIMGGSVLFYLGATPFIYNEDFAWSVPLTIGSLFALIGVMEKPSWGRVIVSGLFILATNLNRAPTGYACVIAAVLVAGWFVLGLGGASRRRWALPLLVVAVVAFGASCGVTYAKFGLPVGLPMADQIWAHVNAHRRYFLAANGGKAFSFAFLPSTLTAYLQPAGLHLSDIFPFITPPTSPAAAVGGAVLDQTYPTASIPATMPLLFLLTCWGVVTAFRPRAVGQVRLARLVLIAAAAGTCGVLLWGYISERYMADFMPLIVLASAIGTIDIWRRITGRRSGRSHSVRTHQRTRAKGFTVLTVLTVIGAFCIATNIAISVGPVSQWTTTQARRYVQVQQRLSIGSLAGTVKTGATLPYWAPAGQLFAVNHCSGLYLSTGNHEKDVPGQQIQHLTWLPVEQGPGIAHTLGFTFNRSGTTFARPVPLLRYGPSTLVVRPARPGYARLELVHSGTSIKWPPALGWVFPILYAPNQFQITVITDPNLNSMVTVWYGTKMIGHYVAGKGPAVVQATPTSTHGPTPSVSVVKLEPPATSVALCRSLVQNH